MSTDTDGRREAGHQRRAAAARQGLDRRSYPPGAGRDRGLRRPAPELMTVAEARDAVGPLTVAEALAELAEEDKSGR